MNSHAYPFSRFHGRSGTVLDSVGVSVGVHTVVGPWPVSAGEAPLEYTSKGPISQISITYDDVIHSLKFASQDVAAVLHESNLFGKAAGSKAREIDIEKDDKITNISGTLAYFGDWFISRLHISTEKKDNFGPFGAEGKVIKFSFPVQDGYISGFQGKSADALRAIDVYVKPL